MGMVLLKALRDFLSLPVIINPLPITLTNGTNADATQVMTDLNWIVSQVNSNVPALVGNTPITFVPQSSVGRTINAFTLTPSPAASAYSDGLSYRFVPFGFPSDNTVAVTINVSGLGAKTLFNALGETMTGGDFASGYTIDICYSAVLNGFVCLSASGGAQLSYTPTLLFGGANVGMTFSTQTGQYNKLPGGYSVAIVLVLTAKGSSTGVATIALPYLGGGILAGGGGNLPCAQIQASNLTYGGQIALAPTNATTARIQAGSSASVVSFLTDTAFANNTAIYASGFIPN